MTCKSPCTSWDAGRNEAGTHEAHGCASTAARIAESFPSSALTSWHAVRSWSLAASSDASESLLRCIAAKYAIVTPPHAAVAATAAKVIAVSLDDQARPPSVICLATGRAAYSIMNDTATQNLHSAPQSRGLQPLAACSHYFCR